MSWPKSQSACEGGEEDDWNSIRGDGGELRVGGRCTLPNIVVLVARKREATKEQKKNVFGKICVYPAKPARTVVRARVAKRMRDAIG